MHPAQMYVMSTAAHLAGQLAWLAMIAIQTSNAFFRYREHVATQVQKRRAAVLANLYEWLPAKEHDLANASLF